ncbi:MULTISPECIES: DUF680 domain-containing protein [Mesorhizobium]|jgi:hypothetical protein|uniref:DUF680 domain-containing protein n=1 Tax=Mesorhizobium TaxID=68287 RepID=UPI000FCC2AC3|nr:MULTISPECIES: DUF680 domain-containing protein [Mesorhizobium]MCQ8813581.1 DUF680 domain-containing protein [Mesorhizobium sp. SEMIA396]RUU50578.1 DUF680 domain-containing protein [Mesorhizobium sp. M7A.T.Ca.TU.009.01.1.1]RUU80069.1 DUF680 domain-containing protein [Mesorhizobium sp. M7A.T.Ca.TU.009.01.1.2]AZV22771.1 DUF680 domain-containing protein [Mesorhizobium sp. M7A.F.Ce.TU.012.03.2.1]MCF6124998.1 DUF680 domain-containing protein [Mesorhizobium ciceri]
MTKIALTAAAILVATGTAFAGSDNYGSYNANQPVANQSVSNIDTTHTGSIPKSVKTQGDANAKVPAQSGQGIWGR